MFETRLEVARLNAVARPHDSWLSTKSTKKTAGVESSGQVFVCVCVCVVNGSTDNSVKIDKTSCDNKRWQLVLDRALYAHTTTSFDQNQMLF